MDEQKEPKVTASDILFENVYQISEDMINSVYKIVEEASKFESVFRGMALNLQALNANLESHIIKKKWINAADKKKCRARIAQTKVLIDICDEFATECKAGGNRIVDITEKFEDNPKIKGIIKCLVDKLEDEVRDAEGKLEEDLDDCD